MRDSNDEGKLPKGSIWWGDVHNPHWSRQHSRLQGGVGNTTRTREMAVRTGAERGECSHDMAHNARGACGPEQSREKRCMESQMSSRVAPSLGTHGAVCRVYSEQLCIGTQHGQ